LGRLRKLKAEGNLADWRLEIGMEAKDFVSKRFQEKGDTLLAEAGLPLDLRLEKSDKYISKIAGSILLRWAVRLDLSSGRVDAKGADALIQSRHLNEFVQLIMPNAFAGPNARLVAERFPRASVFAVLGVSTGDDALFEDCQSETDILTVLEYRFIDKGTIPPLVVYHKRDGTIGSVRWKRGGFSFGKNPDDELSWSHE
jgi:hypothetical protein